MFKAFEQGFGKVFRSGCGPTVSEVEMESLVLNKFAADTNNQSLFPQQDLFFRSLK